MDKSAKCNYRLIDCGDFEKLESVDDFIIRRPAPQAFWKRKLSPEIWDNYNAGYVQSQAEWKIITDKKLPNFQFNSIVMNLRLSPNGQIGIFPEQMQNWKWLQNLVDIPGKSLNILNGFAYTGAATLAVSNSHTRVTHIDAASSSVNWAKQNSKLSGRENLHIRWIVEDIRAYMKREYNRGVRYDGIILDPPAFGRSKKGGVWKIGKDLPALMKLVSKTLSAEPQFILLSSHDRNFGKMEMKKLLKHSNILKGADIETLDLVIKSKSGNDLPAGECVRCKI